MKQEKIIDVINKLRALGTSSNEHEAALALEKARLLMLKYNIEEEQLHGVDNEIIEVDFTVSHSSEKLYPSILLLVRKGIHG